MSQNVRVVMAANWDREVLQDPGLVLVDFWAEWCAPCRKLTPVVEGLADEYAGRVKVVKLDVDESPELAGRYNVYSIPTLLLFRGGQVVEQRVGFRPREELRTLLDTHRSGEAAAAR